MAERFVNMPYGHQDLQVNGVWPAQHNNINQPPLVILNRWQHYRWLSRQTLWHLLSTWYRFVNLHCRENHAQKRHW